MRMSRRLTRDMASPHHPIGFGVDRVTDGAAAGDDLGVHTEIGVAEALHQGVRDVEIPRGGFRVGVGGGAAHDSFHHLEWLCGAASRSWRISIENLIFGKYCGAAGSNPLGRFSMA
jgi:hypothetical protein